MEKNRIDWKVGIVYPLDEKREKFKMRTWDCSTCVWPHNKERVDKLFKFIKRKLERMTTSANVIEYTIYKKGKCAGRFSKHMLCKYPDYAELLKYQPLKEHTIQPWGYDEEEEEWSDNEQNLEKFLKKMAPYNKWLRAYFAGEKTVEQIMQEFKDINDEMFRKMNENFAKKR